MKILLITDSLSKGGKERRMIEMIKGFQKYPDVQIELVIFRNTIEYPEAHDLIQKIHVLERKVKKDPTVFSRFFKICKNFQPDLIHSWGGMPSVYAMPSVKMLGIKFINALIVDAPAGLSLSDERYVKAKLTFPFSDMIIGNSNAGLDAYKAPKEKSVCVYNGFDFRRTENLLSQHEIRERFNIQTPFVVGMIGAFADRKDYNTYLKAAMKVADQRDDVTFLAIGGGKNLEPCKAMVPDSYEGRIVFTGMQNNVESIINVFTLGILATNSDMHGEGISNAILEYMGLSKPVVATIGGGTGEIVTDDVTGYLVEPKQPEQMAEKIIKMLDHPERAIEMGLNGRDRVEKDFNLASMTQTYYSLYNKVLQRDGIHTH
ncbi:MAG: glycosyltransferase [Bacteroidia bacterium]|nr:glycosyltransferase [Bacteroidia bacterium]